MSEISRREFFKKTAADAAVVGILASAGVKLYANPLGLPIGSQTYPHRQLIKDGNFAGPPKTLKEIGVERIELCSAIGYTDFANLADGKATKKIARRSRAQVRERALQHEGAARVTGQEHRLGQRDRHDADDDGQPRRRQRRQQPRRWTQVKKAADEYNKIAAVAAKAGIQQGLHNEGFELAMVDGKRVYDMLFDLLDPKLVKFQFQMSTITSGLVAADYFNNHPGRFISMHVQDVDMNAPAPPPPPPPRRAIRRRPGGVAAAAAARPSAEGGRRGHHRLGQDLQGGEDGRREELLRRAEHGSDEGQRRRLKAMKVVRDRRDRGQTCGLTPPALSSGLESDPGLTPVQIVIVRARPTTCHRSSARPSLTTTASLWSATVGQMCHGMP